MSSAKELSQTQYKFVRDWLIRAEDMSGERISMAEAEILLDGGYIDIEGFKTRRDWPE